jgi:hypothetical protein
MYLFKPTSILHIFLNEIMRYFSYRTFGPLELFWKIFKFGFLNNFLQKEKLIIGFGVRCQLNQLCFLIVRANVHQLRL